ncbi:MAG: hypothetical protein J6Q14_08430 [Oscillospiraceae bacterium]|nr:hypothetical protein [Oscillospiraceae bacterium]
MKTEEVAEAVQTAEAPAEETDEVALLKAQIEAMKEEMAKQMESFKEAMTAAQKPQVVQVTASTEQVHFLWQAPVADDNVQDFGPGGMYGRIIGKTGEFFVPKNDLSRILDNITRMCLDRRWLIVVDGLSEDEREALGVNYNEGELLDRKAFAKMIELGDKILEIFPALCEGHKEMVAKRFYEGWMEKNPHIHRDTVAELNRMAKDAGMKNNAFSAIIEGMNAEQV